MSDWRLPGGQRCGYPFFDLPSFTDMSSPMEQFYCGCLVTIHKIWLAYRSRSIPNSSPLSFHDCLQYCRCFAWHLMNYHSRTPHSFAWTRGSLRHAEDLETESLAFFANQLWFRQWQVGHWNHFWYSLKHVPPQNSKSQIKSKIDQHLWFLLGLKPFSFNVKRANYQHAYWKNGFTIICSCCLLQRYCMQQALKSQCSGRFGSLALKFKNSLSLIPRTYLKSIATKNIYRKHAMISPMP